jgi:hypothetical protein
MFSAAELFKAPALAVSACAPVTAENMKKAAVIIRPSNNPNFIRISLLG